MEQPRTNPYTQKPCKYQPKPEFEARMNKILKLSKSTEQDIKAYWETLNKKPLNSIRCNTLKIQPEELKKKLEEEHKWKISQPFKEKHPEIMIIETPLFPGQLGKSKEHILGFYYVQDISSMMPIIALNPSEQDSFIDLCASPGSKTTQAAAAMKNRGIIIANDNNQKRSIILFLNLERCGVSNEIITKRDSVQLCRKLKNSGYFFNKVLVDVPCSGEGTFKDSSKEMKSWNLKTIENLSKQQKAIAASALEILKEGGEMIYSTCTYAPEENEEVIQYLLENSRIKIEQANIPLKAREGLAEWKKRKFSPELKKCIRIYPQDSNTEGFFLCKIKKLESERQAK